MRMEDGEERAVGSSSWRRGSLADGDISSPRRKLRARGVLLTDVAASPDRHDVGVAALPRWWVVLLEGCPPPWAGRCSLMDQHPSAQVCCCSPETVASLVKEDPSSSTKDSTRWEETVNRSLCQLAANKAQVG